MKRLAFLHSAVIGAGGLGMCAATSLGDLLAQPFRIEAYGPGRGRWPLPSPPPDVPWHLLDPRVPPWVGRYSHRRWMAGRHLFLVDRAVGRAAERAIAARGADACFAFSGVALETLGWASRYALPTMLECATGHVRHFYEINRREHRRWGRGPYIGYPSLARVEREEAEYALASAIRVSSTWAAASFVRHGVPAGKIRIVPQTIDLQRFVPPAGVRRHEGPLRLCFVGGASLGKGMPYLLDALNRLGAGATSLEIAGSTGTRTDRRVFERLKRGLHVSMQPQDPVPVYQRAEVMVFPSLHDGFGFAVAEAMACGLPVIVTDSTGAADWVGADCGWVVPAGDAEQLASAIAAAGDRRHELDAMGLAARGAVERQIAARGASLPLFDVEGSPTSSRPPSPPLPKPSK